MTDNKKRNKVKIDAVIDSSFWINIVFLDLQEYLLKYFNLFFVSKVEEEILNTGLLLDYDSKDMIIYRFLKNKELLEIKNPKLISKKLLDNLQKDSGELYSIAFSLEKKIILLMDDSKAYSFCNKNNYFVINNIDFIFFLRNKKDLDTNNCIKKIKKLKNKVKKEYIDEALKKMEANL